MRTKLSILIPSLLRRRDVFTRLMYVLHPQLTHEVELLVDVDNGELSTGFKRQRLLHRSHGDYIAFIDDDDLVAYNYVEDILNSMDSKPDAIGFNSEVKSLQNGKTKLCKMSMEYDGFSNKDGVYLRGIQHLNPVRRELALEIGFEDIRIDEDRQYCINIGKIIKTECYIDKVLYKYLTRGCI